MRLFEIISEAWRNLATGTTRALGWGVVLILAGVALITTDQLVAHQIRTDHRDFVDSGATTWIVSSEGNVDAHRCESLAQAGLVEDAGAIRLSETRVAARLPSTELRIFEGTSGILSVLKASPQTGVGTAPSIVLADDLAVALGLVTGQSIEFQGGENAVVSALYSLPEEVQDSQLLNSGIVLAPAIGSWDACWVSNPTSHTEVRQTLAYTLTESATSADPNGGGSQFTVTQLNSRQGEYFDVTDRLASRSTRLLPWAVPILAFAIGSLAMRSRRLEITSAKHVGVANTDLAAMSLLENGTWAGSGMIVITGVTAIAQQLSARDGTGPNPDDVHALLASTALWAVSAGMAATLGAVITTVLLRERGLYRHFRQR